MTISPKIAPIVIIGGPTASGKSAVSSALAQLWGNGVVINADALQMYRDLRVLTARPSEADESAAPHRLYGVVDGNTRSSVADWLALVRREIAAAFDAGQRPIVVGGSGMYLNALMQGLSPIPEIDPQHRAAAVARHAAMGGAAFRAELATLDPISAGKLHDGDTQRLIRAYEVVTSTGKPLPVWQTEPSHLPPSDWQFAQFVITPNRATLYANCNLRFDLMLKKGALAEVDALLARTLSPEMPIMKAVGVPELAAVLRGTMPLNEAKTAAQQATRHYAKRQMTWFRNQMSEATPLVLNTPGNDKDVQMLATNIDTRISLQGDS